MDQEFIDELLALFEFAEEAKMQIQDKLKELRLCCKNDKEWKELLKRLPINGHLPGRPTP
jgi:hypothetical protein